MEVQHIGYVYRRPICDRGLATRDTSERTNGSDCKAPETGIDCIINLQPPISLSRDRTSDTEQYTGAERSPLFHHYLSNTYA